MKLWRVSTRTPSVDPISLHLAQGEYSIGSGADAAIRAHGEHLSSRHALLILGESKMEIHLLDLRGETRLNGRPLEGRAETEYPAVLQVGETIVEVARIEERSAEESTQILRRFERRSVEVKPVELWEQTLRIRRSCADGKEENLVELKSAADHALSGLGPSEVVELEQATLHLDMKPFEFVVERSAPVQMAYNLRNEIARGGMGRIFTAEDPLLDCDVAVKVSSVKSEGGNKQFEREARVLAHLSHPNIVPVHAMGETAQGLPFYSMKLVQGKTLQSILWELKSCHQETCEHYTLKRLLRVFQKVCDAVGFAHAKGFLHRDLKPENVMVGEFGEVLVMDWGLARPLKGNSWGVQQMAQAAHPAEDDSLCIEGTPQYMSPEQAAGGVLDERSDIYALGGLLYAILTKHAPVQAKTLEEVLAKVRRGELSPMTTKRAPLPPGAQNIPITMRSGPPQALRAVTLKALSKDSEARYGSVAELKADVEAFQNGYATEAENANFLRQLILWIIRHRATSALLVVLIFGAIAFTVRLAASEKQALLSALEATENAKKAQASAREAHDSAKEARDNLAEAEDNARRAEANSQKALAEKEHARQETARAQLAFAEAAEQDLNAEVMRRVLGKVPEDLRKQEWHYLQQRTDSSDLTIQAKNATRWLSLLPHPKAPDLLITIQADGWVRRLDLGTGAAEDLFKLDAAKLERGVTTLSADGERLALARTLDKEAPAGLPRQQIEVYALKKPETPLSVVSSWQFKGAGTDLKFSPNGRFLLRTPKNNRSESVAVLDSNSGALLWERAGTGICVAGFSGDSAWVYIYSEYKGLLRLNVVDGSSFPEQPSVPQPAKTIGFAHVGVNDRAAPSADWTCVFVLQGDSCRKIDPNTGKTNFSFRLPTGRLSSSLIQFSYLNLSPSLATISPKSEKCGALQIWDAGSGYLIRSLPVYFERKGTEEWGILTHPVSGQIVVTRGTEMKVWKAPDAANKTELRVPAVSGFSHKPGFILQNMRTHPGHPLSPLDVRLLDLREKPSVVLAGHSFLGGYAADVRVSRNGKILSVREHRQQDQLLSTYEIQEDGQLWELAAVSLPHSRRFAQPSPSGHRVWCWEGVFDGRSGKRLASLNRKGIEFPGEFVGDWVNATSVIEVCQTLTAETPEKKATLEPTLCLWNAETGTLANQKNAPEAVAVAAAPDGSQIAEAGSDMRVRIRNGVTLEVERQFRAHDEALTAVAWHPALPLLATCADDYTLKIWDLRTDTLLETIVNPAQVFTRLSWSPEGASLLATEGATNFSNVFGPKALEAFTHK